MYSMNGIAIFYISFPIMLNLNAVLVLGVKRDH
jgi:hypothetical protein